MPSSPDSTRATALRLALVGIGSAATRAHLPALRRLEVAGSVAVVGLCDPDPARRDEARLRHPGAFTDSDNDRMLDATAPDLLVIATPPSAHLGEMAAAVARGVHVLCEKPLGLSAADVASLDLLARSRPDLMLATVHQYRHAPPWQWIARGAAGAVRGGEPLSIEVRVERPGTDPLSESGWRADPEHEGGILGDHAVHYLSLLRLLDPACTVTSCERRGPGGRERAVLRLRVGAAGVATVDVSYTGSHRGNLIRLDRPAQCLEIEWRDDRLTLLHNGRRGDAHTVPALSDRGVVDALYSPMYADLVAGVDRPDWRAEATEHTLGTARLLARAIEMGR